MKEKKYFRTVSILLVLALSLLLIPQLGTAKAEVYRMKIQSAFPRGDLSMELLKDMARWADEKSNGRIKIRVFAEPEIVPGEQLFAATQKGTLDMLHTVAAMWGGIVPVGEVEFGLPYAYHIPGELPIDESSAKVRKFFLESGFADLLREEYAKHGLFWLDMHSYGQLFTLSTKAVTDCADLKGMKVRAEGAWATYYDMLGARGTFIPGTEAYMGLKLGTIDASQWDVSAIVGLKWHEVAPYWLIGGQNDVVPGQILMNMDTWNSLPDDLKQVMREVAEQYYHELLNIYLEEMDKVAELVEQGEVKKSYLSEPCEKKHREAAYKLWNKIAERDEAAAKATEMIKAWRKTLE